MTAFPLVPWEISHTGLFPLPLPPLEPSTLRSSCRGRGDERAQRQRGGEAGGGEADVKGFHESRRCVES